MAASSRHRLVRRLAFLPLLAALGLGCGATRATAGAAPSVADLPADLVDDLRDLPDDGNGYWLLAGSALTLLARGADEAEGAARLLSGRPLPALAKIGNFWGDARFQIPLALGAWAAGDWRDNRDLACTGYDLSRAQLLTYGVVNLLKVTVDRTRPDGGRYSFPSGHTAAAFTTAAVLSERHGGWLSAVAVTLAGLTGMGRIEDRRHWASDVAAGATLGWIIGRTVADSSLDGAPDPAAQKFAIVLGGRF